MASVVKGSKDPDIIASAAALRRAAKRALELGLRTGTPVWVVKDGKMVDLTKAKRHKQRGTRSGSKSRKS